MRHVRPRFFAFLAVFLLCLAYLKTPAHPHAWFGAALVLCLVLDVLIDLWLSSWFHRWARR